MLEITEVQIIPVDESESRARAGTAAGRLLASASVVIDGCFVVRDLKVMRGADGPFVAMPYRKLTDRCPGCGRRNARLARYCNDCGGRLESGRAESDADGKLRLTADVAHPLGEACRVRITAAVLAAYDRETGGDLLAEYARRPGAGHAGGPLAARRPA